MKSSLIYSNHHQSWWGPNGSGYRSHIADAGRYALEDTAQWLSRGCGCCPVPEVVVDAPTAEILSDPDTLATYAVEAPLAATRAAIAAGQVSPYAQKCERCQDAFARSECCSSHGKRLCHGCYRRTHFVEVCSPRCLQCALEGLPVSFRKAAEAVTAR